MKCSLVVAKTLEELGVKYIFGIPGTHVLSFYDSISKSKIKSIQVTHEQSAGFMADGYSRISKNPGVAVVTTGPGALNIVNAVAQAYVESSAVFVISSNINKNLWGKGAYHELKTPDVQANIFNEITKKVFKVRDKLEVQNSLSEAFHLSITDRPRPVFVEIPENIFDEDLELVLDIKRHEIVKKTISDSQITTFFNELLVSKKPVLIVGGGVSISGAENLLKQFSENLEIPVLHTVMGKSCLASSFDNNFGFSGFAYASDYAIKYLLESDLVIAVGTRFDEVATGFFTTKINGKLIHVDVDPKEFNRNFKSYLNIESDAGRFFEKSLKYFFESKIKSKRGKLIFSKQKEDHQVSKSSFIDPRVLITKTMDFLKNEQAIFVGDAGNSSPWILECDNYPKHKIITPSGYNSMGFSVPAGIGAKLASPESKVISVSGDGSFLMTGMEVLTAIKYKIPFCCIVLSDSRYNMLTLFQDVKHNGVYTDTMIKTFNFSNFANDNGALGIKISSNSEIDLALKKAMSFDGVSIIEAIIDPTLTPKMLSKLRK